MLSLRYNVRRVRASRDAGGATRVDGWLAELLEGLVETLRATDGATALSTLIGVLILCGLGLPIPEDIILVTTGILAALGKFPLWLGIVLCLIGVLCGDAALFFLGRRFGEGLLMSAWAQRSLGHDNITRAQEMVIDNARFICFMARFLPGIRSAIYLVAGAMGVKPRTYLTQDGLAALISVPFWVVVGWWFGHNVDAALETVHRFEGWILSGVALAIVGYVAWTWRARQSAGTEGVGG